MKLDDLHFCGSDKAKFRRHLLAGNAAATAIGFAGTMTGSVWMQAIAVLVNGATAMLWTLE